MSDIDLAEAMKFSERQWYPHEPEFHAAAIVREYAETAAERALGAWLVAHPGERSPDIFQRNPGSWVCLSPVAPRSLSGTGPSRESAIWDALDAAGAEP